MKKISLPFLPAFMISAVILFCSCEDLVETDLSEEDIILTAPSDSITSSSALNMFVWEPVDAATEYQFQLASPRFDSVVLFIKDTITGNNSIQQVLAPGNYQWRVKARNNTSSTPFKTRTINIQ